MAHDNQLAQRVRASLAGRKGVKEQPMMGGLIFMVNDKMCVGVIKNDLMVRMDPERREELLAKPGCRLMEFKRRRSQGFVLIDPSGIKRLRSALCSNMDMICSFETESCRAVFSIDCWMVLVSTNAAAYDENRVSVNHGLS